MTTTAKILTLDEPPTEGAIVLMQVATCWWPLRGSNVVDTEAHVGAVLWADREPGGGITIWLDTGAKETLSHPFVEGWRLATDTETAAYEAARNAAPTRPVGPRAPSTLWLLEQDVEWWTQDRRRIGLDAMDPGHRANLIAFLNRRARSLFLSYSLSGVFNDAPDDVLTGLDNTDPHEWMAAQPLMRRLQELHAGDGAS